MPIVFTEWEEESPGSVPRDVLVGSYEYLGTGYQRRGALEEARAAWQEVVALAPGTESAKSAQAGIARLADAEPEGTAASEREGTTASERTPHETPAMAELKAELEERPDDTLLLVDVGRGYVELGEYEAAVCEGIHEPHHRPFHSTLPVWRTPRPILTYRPSVFLHLGTPSTTFGVVRGPFRRVAWRHRRSRHGEWTHQVMATSRLVGMSPCHPAVAAWVALTWPVPSR